MEEMTRERALELLRGGADGVKAWNDWRKENASAKLPDLQDANLSQADLSHADLLEAILSFFPQFLN